MEYSIVGYNVRGRQVDKKSICFLNNYCLFNWTHNILSNYRKYITALAWRLCLWFEVPHRTFVMLTLSLSNLIDNFYALQMEVSSISDCLWPLSLSLFCSPLCIRHKSFICAHPQRLPYPPQRKNNKISEMNQEVELKVFY